MNLLPRGPVTRRRVSYQSTVVFDTESDYAGRRGVNGMGSGHHQLQQLTAGARQHPATLRRGQELDKWTMTDSDTQGDRQTDIQSTDNQTCS